MADSGRTARKKTVREENVDVDISVAQFPYLNTGPDAQKFKEACVEYCVLNEMRVIDEEVVKYAIDHLEFDIDFWKQPRKMCAFYAHNASEKCPAGPWTPEFYAAKRREDSARIDELKRQLRAERDERILKNKPTVYSSVNAGTKRKSVEAEDSAPSAGKKDASAAKRRKSKPVIDWPMEIPEAVDFDEPANADKQKPKERVRFLKANQEDFDRFDKPNSLFISYRDDDQTPLFCMIPNDHPNLSIIRDDLQKLDWLEYEAAFSALKNNVFKGGEAKEFWETVRTMFTTDGLAINTFYASDIRYNAAFKDDDLCPASAQEFQVMPEMVKARIDRTAAFFRDSEPDSGKADALDKFWDYFISSQCMRDYERHLEQMPIYDALHDKLMTDMKNPLPTEDDMDQIEEDARALIEYGRMSESIYQIVLSNMRLRVEDNAGLEDGTLCSEEEMRQFLKKFLEYETRYTPKMMDDYLKHRRELIELTKKMDDDDFILNYEQAHNETLRATLNDIPGVWQSVAAAYEPVRKAAQARMADKAKRDELEAQKNQATAELEEQKRQADDLRRQLAALQQQLAAAEGKAPAASRAPSPGPAPAQSRAASPGRARVQSRAASPGRARVQSRAASPAYTASGREVRKPANFKPGGV